REKAGIAALGEHPFRLAGEPRLGEQCAKWDARPLRVAGHPRDLLCREPGRGLTERSTGRRQTAVARALDRTDAHDLRKAAEVGEREDQRPANEAVHE